MSRSRRWLRYLQYFVLLSLAVIPAWNLGRPFVEAKPNSQWRLHRFMARINGALYMAELREEVSQPPYWIIHDVRVSLAPVANESQPTASIPRGIWPLRVEAARGSQRVRLLDNLTDEVVVDKALVEWLPIPNPAFTTPPVVWHGDQLLLWPSAPSTKKPEWRKNEDDIATFGRQYYLGVYKWFALKVGGIAISAALLLLISVWLIDRWLRHTPGACQKCGYNLRGNTSERCPECGTAAPQ